MTTMGPSYPFEGICNYNSQMMQYHLNPIGLQILPSASKTHEKLIQLYDKLNPIDSQLTCSEKISKDNSYYKGKTCKNAEETIETQCIRNKMTEPKAETLIDIIQKNSDYPYQFALRYSITNERGREFSLSLKPDSKDSFSLNCHYARRAATCEGKINDEKVYQLSYQARQISEWLQIESHNQAYPYKTPSTALPLLGRFIDRATESIPKDTDISPESPSYSSEPYAPYLYKTALLSITGALGLKTYDILTEDRPLSERLVRAIPTAFIASAAAYTCVML